jgi:hypothetical protein
MPWQVVAAELDRWSEPDLTVQTPAARPQGFTTDAAARKGDALDHPIQELSYCAIESLIHWGDLAVRREAAKIASSSLASSSVSVHRRLA